MRRLAELYNCCGVRLTVMNKVYLGLYRDPLWRRKLGLALQLGLTLVAQDAQS